jgi:hypothetical protein
LSARQPVSQTTPTPSTGPVSRDGVRIISEKLRPTLFAIHGCSSCAAKRSDLNLAVDSCHVRRRVGQAAMPSADGPSSHPHEGSSRQQHVGRASVRATLIAGAEAMSLEPRLRDNASGQEDDSCDEPRQRVQVLDASRGCRVAPARRARPATLHPCDEKEQKPGAAKKAERGAAGRLTSGQEHGSDGSRNEHEWAEAERHHSQGQAGADEHPGPKPNTRSRMNELGYTRAHRDSVSPQRRSGSIALFPVRLTLVRP